MPSLFTPGTSSLDSTTLPGALFEAARILDAAENARNGANPGVPAKQNISVTVDFGTRTIGISATLPIQLTQDTSGKMVVDAVDYLGTTYSAFTAGGDVKSSDAPSAFLEVAQQVAAAEKAILPAEDQPNNVQITVDVEAGNVSIAAAIPCTTSADTDGSVIISAVDYF